MEEELIRGLQAGLIKWYDLKTDSTILYIGKQEDAFSSLFLEINAKVVYADCQMPEDTQWQQKHFGTFDYIICIEALEHCKDPVLLLRLWRTLLKEDGRMLVGMNNRFGIKNFCGDRDPYTERNFDGVEGYRRAYVTKEDCFCGRTYSRAELKHMLQEAGWEFYQFYSLISNLKNPVLFYAEDTLPKEDLANRVVFPTYNYPDTVFLEEESLYNSLIENDMFHQMANAYLIECSLSGELSDVCHVTSSMERGLDQACFTIIHRSGVVEKRAISQRGRDHLEQLVHHNEDLKAHGLSVVEGKMENGAYVMPFVDAEVGQVYLKRLLQSDKDSFLRALDYFRELILCSSEIVKEDCGDGTGAILRCGYLDLVPLNSFYIDGKFVFYDQEFCEEYYPANAIISRMLTSFYAGNLEFHKIIPIDLLQERYGLSRYRERWLKLEWDFLLKLRKEKELLHYHQTYCRNADVLNANRQRMNYSEEAYQRLFVDIFRNADTRKLILFGAGIFAKRFLDLYQQDYPVYAIVDNNEKKWGQKLNGVEVCSPQLLTKLQSGEYKVIICIRNYLSVMKQLDEMGVAAYSIFELGKNYIRERKPILLSQKNNAENELKKFHTGYIAGVFDLFHIGHLNMFKRAKEQCNYLIVGVVSDEGVSKYKQTQPFIPFAERFELVRACRYVDEVVEIPLNFGGTKDAWKLRHFDCQFSGSDYADNPDWLADKKFLEEHGAEMVFFPYTNGTSSSKIKALIERKLM